MHPVLFQVGSFKLHSFGVAMVVAFFSGLALARANAKRFGINQEDLTDVAVIALIAGVLGARILFIAQEWKNYAGRWNQILSLQFQGLTSFGGPLFGIPVLLWMARRKNINPLAVLECATAPFILGHAIGRIGCLLNGCCYGHVCPPGTWYGVLAEDKHLHFPAQLVDSGLNIGALLVLLAIQKRSPRPGVVIASGFVLHGTARFLYEFLRAGSSSTYWGKLPITEAQGVALGFVLIGITLFILTRKFVRNDATSPSVPEATPEASA